ncbi:HD domain-containing phosphohydrolase [Deinococcus maricopensis]|uniref:HD domain-containing phosphohydrolase n=1 Tax=Deinococcus maricopensis TaxID=309887 RepID=UPI00030338DF|nr:HD domain-containing phosphohydrolase [Deinococcus maricopensis]
MFRRPQQKPPTPAPSSQAPTPSTPSAPDDGKLLTHLLARPTLDGIMEAALAHAATLVGGTSRGYAVVRRGQDRVIAVYSYDRELVGVALSGPWSAGRARITDGSGELLGANPPEVRARLDVLGMHEIRHSLIVPLKDKSRQLGAFVLDRYTNEGFTPTQQESVARWAKAVAPLVSLFDTRDDWRETSRQLTTALVEAVESLDFDAVGHAPTVASHAQKLGRALGLSERELEEVWYAAMLHDVGKIGGEPGHALMGANFLHGAPTLTEVQKAVRHHHERWDGQGEPDHLTAEDIPLYARIIAVANTYVRVGDVARLQQQAGKALDPRLVTLFEKILQQEHDRAAPPADE